MEKKDIEEKLKRIDEDIFFSGVRGDRRPQVVIVGGGALLVRDLTSRAVTKDVDILQDEADDAARRILYSDPDFNNACAAYLQSIPYNFEDRLVPLDLDTLAVDYRTPSVEDLAVMKLYRWEASDKLDLTSEEFLSKLDWEQLDYLITSPCEAAASRIALLEQDREFKNLLHNYEEYKRGWRR